MLVSILRYACHVISGATVWAGLSIPTNAALIYSIGYNATYMIPETIITAACAYYLSSLIDFNKETPTRRRDVLNESAVAPYRLLSGASLLLGLVIDVWIIAPCLQNSETGEFVLSGIKNADFISIAVVSAITVALSVFLFIKGRVSTKD